MLCLNDDSAQSPTTHKECDDVNSPVFMGNSIGYFTQKSLKKPTTDSRNMLEIVKSSTHSLCNSLRFTADMQYDMQSLFTNRSHLEAVPSAFSSSSQSRSKADYRKPQRMLSL
uniref:Uncharacterized protein n=1 Tax=Glossina pallidipes TaxID=7398 RepID=A0A1B0A0D6_GLOPL